MTNDPSSAQANRPSTRQNRSIGHQARGGRGSGGDVGQCIIVIGSPLKDARSGLGRPMASANTAGELAHFAAQNDGGHFAAPLQQVQSS